MFPKQGILNILKFMLASADFELTYRLFKNNITVDADTVLGDFTESTFTGYAAKNAVAEPAPTIIAGPEAKSAGDELTWTCTADITAQQAFGMYVTFTNESSADALLFAWNFDAPTTIAFNGDVVKKKVDWYTKNFAP